MDHMETTMWGILENQREKNMENHMGTPGLLRGVYSPGGDITSTAETQIEKTSNMTWKLVYK